jgi:hypothetical protein
MSIDLLRKDLTRALREQESLTDAFPLLFTHVPRQQKFSP